MQSSMEKEEDDLHHVKFLPYRAGVYKVRHCITWVYWMKWLVHFSQYYAVYSVFFVCLFVCLLVCMLVCLGIFWLVKVATGQGKIIFLFQDQGTVREYFYLADTSFQVDLCFECASHFSPK